LRQSHRGSTFLANDREDNVKTAAQAAANWANSQTRAVQAYSDGVAAYTGDWAGATVAQEQTLLQNVSTAIINGDWRRGVQAKGTNGWKTDTEAKKANFGVGFQAGAAAQAKAAAKIQAALGTIVSTLPPRGSFEQNKLRATGVMDALHALRGTLGAV
jgi:hypothetical protein